MKFNRGFLMDVHNDIMADMAEIRISQHIMIMAVIFVLSTMGVKAIWDSLE